MNKYPIVVGLEKYRDFDVWIMRERLMRPNMHVSRITRDKRPIEATIDDEDYVFVTWDDYQSWCKGRRYYDMAGNLFDSGWCIEPVGGLIKSEDLL